MKQPNNVALMAAAVISSLMLFNAAHSTEASKIEAGDDQRIRFPAPAYLNASIHDDQPPYLTIGWMKEEGPGEVQFSDRHSPVTMALFSEPGEYRLMLGGYDGEISHDTVIIVVEP